MGLEDMRQARFRVQIPADTMDCCVHRLILLQNEKSLYPNLPRPFIMLAEALTLIQVNIQVRFIRLDLKK